MKKGNTIIVSIDTDLDLTNANKVVATFSQAGKILLIKTGDQVEVDDKTVSIYIEEEETYLFEAGRFVPVEIEAFFDRGSVTSNTMYRGFDGTVKSQNTDVVKVELDISDMIDRINGEVIG